MARYKPLIFLFLVVMGLSCGGSIVAHGQTINPAVVDVQARIDNLWDGLEPDIEQRQARYYNMTGRYFQGLPFHNSIPDGDTEGEYPLLWYTHPTDQQYRWDDFGGFPFARYPFLAWIDVYNGPEGSGYVVCLQAIIERGIYEKCRNYGPEALRGHDWEAIKIDEARAAIR